MTKLYAIRCNPKATGVTTYWYDEATSAEIAEAAGMEELRSQRDKLLAALSNMSTLANLFNDYWRAGDFDNYAEAQAAIAACQPKPDEGKGDNGLSSTRT